MLLLYNLGIRIYWCLAHVAASFYPKAKLWLAGRRQWHPRLQRAMAQLQVRPVWVHCSSLGEFEQGRPLIEAIKARNPQQPVVLSFYSPSGYEVRKGYPLADYVCYLPLDTRRNAQRFVETLNPSLAIFVKYEFWYHMLGALNGAKVPTYVVSAIFRPQQVFFKSYGCWYRRFLQRFTHLFVQDEQSVELLRGIGICNATACGDTRFDRVAAIARSADTIPEVERFCALEPHRPVLVAGSTWPPDEELLAAYMRTSSGLRLIIAPHEVHDAHLRLVEQRFGFAGTVRYTQLRDGSSPSTGARVLIVDTIGLLAAIYRYGQVAYGGGGFGVGIHNTLEAAVYGMPVLFGPNYRRFNEAVGLLAHGGAFVVDGPVALARSLDGLLSSPEHLAHSAEASRRYVQSMTGATQAVMAAIDGALKL